MVSGLAYSSRAREAFDDETLLELSNFAAAKNQSLGITGYLYYRNEFFMQYLEGPQKTVENLMAKITTDPRHQILSTISLPSYSERIFPHWYMRFLAEIPPTIQLPTLEDELRFIIDTTSQEQYERDEVADAILHVTQRIATLDW